MMMSQRFIRSSVSAIARSSRQASTKSNSTWSAADVQLKPDEVKSMFRAMAMEDDEKHNELIYSISFTQGQAPEESAWNSSSLTNQRMKDQLENSRNQLRHEQQQSKLDKSPSPIHHTDNEPLPKSLDDALRPSKRAIVVTETVAPFRIVDVNQAWQDLCGYSFVESQGRSLGDLLQGPETNQVASTALVSKLLQGEEAGTVLTNYTKDGRAFKNRVRVGPLLDKGELRYFVGVLEEMKM